MLNCKNKFKNFKSLYNLKIQIIIIIMSKQEYVENIIKALREIEGVGDVEITPNTRRFNVDNRFPDEFAETYWR